MTVNATPNVPCFDCAEPTPVDLLHDEHDEDCAVTAALMDDRPTTDDDYDACTCPERLVCATCCNHCNVGPGGERRYRKVH